MCICHMRLFLYSILLLAVTFINNVTISLEYQQKYVPDNFPRALLIDPKYRCISYFDKKTYLKYTHMKCEKYKKDYIIFQLEKSLHIFDYLVYNLGYMILLSPILFI
jgi:hypothetical protein